MNNLYFAVYSAAMSLTSISKTLFACALLILSTGLTSADQIPLPPEPANLSEKEQSALIAIYDSLVAESRPLQVGDPESDVLKRMGSPEGTMTIGSRQRLSYGDGSIITADGKIVQINNIPEEWLAAPSRTAFEDYQKAKGNVWYMGKWMTKWEAQEAYRKAIKAKDLKEQRVVHGKTQKAKREQQIARAKAPMLDYRQNGQRISQSELTVKGKVTVVDFYADWCGPCKQIAPYLQKLATDPEVAVRKVDIVTWGSPVAKQWKLSSIPNMRVYDKNGRAVGKPIHDIREVMKLVREAKRK